jgi:hypothetical protein
MHALLSAYWTDAHHVFHWGHGGVSDLSNLGHR